MSQTKLMMEMFARIRSEEDASQRFQDQDVRDAYDQMEREVRADVSVNQMFPKDVVTGAYDQMEREFMTPNAGSVNQASTQFNPDDVKGALDNMEAEFMSKPSANTSSDDDYEPVMMSGDEEDDIEMMPNIPYNFVPGQQRASL